MVFHCNYGRILYGFRNKAKVLVEKRQFFIPIVFILHGPLQLYVM